MPVSEESSSEPTKELFLDYKDYYATLGVDRKASKSEIQKAYRKLARKFHPDVNKTPEGEERFKEITEAYEVLKDKEKRAKYDQFGSAWKQAQSSGGPPPGFEDLFAGFGGGGGGGRGFSTAGDGGFSSFFEMLFGGGGGGATPGGGARGFQWAGQAPPQPAADHEARLTLTLEEAARGGQREITLRDDAAGKPKTLRVKIPRGVKSGQRIRLSGQGGASSAGERGDLYLRIDVLPDPRFDLDGQQLHSKLKVTPWEAALGGEAEVATLEGPVRVKIPAGSSSGRKIRLRGKGYPTGKGAAGDLIVELQVVLPDELTDAERDLFQQLSDVSPFTPRAGSSR